MRGLKHRGKVSEKYIKKSHLLQMRGLKPPAVGDGMISATSHLLQMRGLKLTIKNKRIITSVASFTDAWIETVARLRVIKQRFVASFTDAWIETGAYQHL